MNIKNENDFLKICKFAFRLTIKGYVPNLIKLHNPLPVSDIEEIQRILDFQAETPDTIFEKLEKALRL